MLKKRGSRKGRGSHCWKWSAIAAVCFTVGLVRFDNLQNSLDDASIIGVVMEQNADQNPVATNRTCPTQFRTGMKGTEHSPMIFQVQQEEQQQSTAKELVICRTPKVGSTMLRRLALARAINSTFDASHKEERWMMNTLDLKNMTLERFQHLAFSKNGDSVTRIMFVRHPVMRILSGFMLGSRWITQRGILDEHQGSKRVGQFANFVFHEKGLRADYKPNCWSEDEADGESIQPIPHYARMSRHPRNQHWAPPQHCRCGINDCNIDYIPFHLERIPSIQQVFQEHVSPGDKTPIWMPPSTAKANARRNTGRSYSRFFMNATVLKYLNDLTKPEREYFGYLPITLEQVETGTVALTTDG